jgi:uncharacterized DUF497 family protein
LLEFEWDDGNIERIAQHGVTPAEAEYVLTHPTMDLDYDDEHDEERFAEVGSTANGRILTVWTTWRGDRIGVVTAFDAPKADKAAYPRMVTR